MDETKTAVAPTVSFRLIWTLSLPVLIESLLAMLVGWSDTVLAGHLLVEEKYLSAIAVDGYLLWFLESFVAIVSTGALAIVARHVGAQELGPANRVLAQSMVLAGGLGVAMLAGTWLGASALSTAMNLRGESQQLATLYLHIVAVSFPGMAIMLVGVACLRAAGLMLAGMWIGIAVNVINVAASWTLARGGGPIPAMGWAGIATGSAISFLAGGAMTLALLFRGRGELRLPAAWPRPDVDVFRRILRIGVPGVANAIGIVLCHLWFLRIIGHLGERSLAAHGVAIRCESISWLVADAFAVAASTLVGQSLGASRPAVARSYGWMVLRLGLASMALVGFLLYALADLLVLIFVPADRTDVIEPAAAVLRLVAFGEPALAIITIATGSLRGAGDTISPFLYNTLGLLLVRIPLAYALTDGVVSWGLWGAWLAMVADLYVRGGVSLAQYAFGSWTRIRV